jgi:hypothetical protein
MQKSCRQCGTNMESQHMMSIIWLVVLASYHCLPRPCPLLPDFLAARCVIFSVAGKRNAIHIASDLAGVLLAHRVTPSLVTPITPFLEPGSDDPGSDTQWIFWPLTGARLRASHENSQLRPNCMPASAQRSCAHYSAV